MAVSKKKAAPKKPAAKVGRPKAIESPERMWELFQQYKQEVKDNPIIKKVEGNKDFILSKESLRRPLTLEGFEVWCFEKGIINDLGDYFSNKNGAYSNFSTICLLIRKYIRQDQIEGGMVGIYNHSITQRLNGLVEKVQEDGSKEVTIKVKYEKKETPKD